MIRTGSCEPHCKGGYITKKEPWRIIVALIAGAVLLIKWIISKIGRK